MITRESISRLRWSMLVEKSGGMTEVSVAGVPGGLKRYQMSTALNSEIVHVRAREIMKTKI